jgi:hypothetical protein
VLERGDAGRARRHQAGMRDTVPQQTAPVRPEASARGRARKSSSPHKARRETRRRQPTSSSGFRVGHALTDQQSSSRRRGTCQKWSASACATR